MAFKRSDKGDIDFLRASWDLLGDVCLAGGVRVAIMVLPTDRRGVFTIEVRAIREVPNQGREQVARYVCEYPTAHVQELSAAIYRAINQLDKLVAEKLGGKLDDAYEPVR